MNKPPTRVGSLLLLLNLFLLAPLFSSAANIYVTPTEQIACPGKPCLTLSQYTNESAKYLISNTVMIFLPGEHKLNVQVNVTNVNNFSMMGEKEMKTSVICSGSECGGIYFENVLKLTILSLSFSSVGSSIGGVNVHDFLLKNCTFAHNGNTAILVGYSDITLDGNIFENNSAYDPEGTTDSEDFLPGGGIAILASNANLQGQNTFINNTCVRGICGGSAIYAKQSTVQLGGNTSFVNNTLENRLPAHVENACGGGTLFTLNTNISVTGSAIFANNSIRNTNITSKNFACEIGGGGVSFLASNATVSGQVTFLRNHAKGRSLVGCGGGLYAFETSITISGNLAFVDNTVDLHGGGMHMEAGQLYIEGTVSFIHNIGGGSGGGIRVVLLQPMLVTGTMLLDDNHANNYSCEILTRGSTGGGWDVELSTVNITGEVLVTNNSAKCKSGGINFFDSNVVASGNVSVITNSAYYGGGIVIQGGNGTLLNAVFINNSAVEGGGMIIQFCKSVKISGEFLFLSNKASYNGGGITILQSILNISGSLNMTKNIANAFGGAVASNLSEIVIYGDLFVAENIATNSRADGGGMSVSSSTVDVFGNVTIVNNFAAYGGGLWFYNTSLAIAKKMKFIRNIANIAGGAIFISDITILAYCASKIHGAEHVTAECFFRNRSQGHEQILMEFDGNEALTGTVLVGGSIDRCTVDGQLLPNSGKVFDSITHISNAPHPYSVISSQPFRVCLCENNQPRCGDSLDITTYPGKTFSIQAVVTGQRNGTVPGMMVYTQVNPITVPRLGVFEDRQLLKQVECSSSTLNYTVYSNIYKNVLELYVPGSCSALDGSEERPSINVYINLHCPSAFSLSAGPPYQCICEERLQKYTNSCDINGQTILRDRDFWVGYNNDSNSQGLILHPHCPFDYCKAGLINFTMDDTDLQCKANRTGLLCGTCAPGLSLGLGSSKCLDCSNLYLFLILAFAVMGIVFVLFFLVFIIFTVKSGAISGLVFYASIVGANQNIFFPPGHKNYLGKYLMPWIRLDFGVDTCFYDGMDMYARTWLQFVFPIYVLVLLFICIIVYMNRRHPALSKCYSKATLKFLSDVETNKISHSNTSSNKIPHPVYVMATFFVLAYGKIVHTVIVGLSYTTLEYPNNKTEIVWLYDANIKYLHGKHIPLFAVSVLLSVVFIVPFTALLLFGQLIQKIHCMPAWMKRPIDGILNLYHTPYVKGHGYWPGLLLAVRLALFLIFGANALRDYSENLLAISAASFGLLAWPWIFGSHMYKKKWFGALEASYILNLGVFAAATFYNIIQQSGGSQAIVADISTIIALLSFLITLAYQIYDQRKDEICKMLGHIGMVCRCNCQLRGKAYEEIQGENSASVNYDPDIVKST